jgi:hypothetical protein
MTAPDLWQHVLAGGITAGAGAWLLRRRILKRRSKTGCDACAAAAAATRRPPKPPLAKQA